MTDYKDTVFLPQTDFPMRAGLAKKEPAILQQWQDIQLYQKLRAERKDAEKFILHDGPPYANGDIHMGHALNKILKDIIVRSQTLLGKDAPYIPGWDCHGLPIEWKIEEQYRKKKQNKDDVPAREFRQQCRDYAQKWVDIQREQFKRLGVMGDWDDPYLTMTHKAEAMIATELLKFAEHGQLYRGAKPVMWSPVEKTALAEAEIEYQDIVSTQIDVSFEIIEAPNCPEIQNLIDQGESVSAVIWTTTPWTIPVNQALSYGENINYIVGSPGAALNPTAPCEDEKLKNEIVQFLRDIADEFHSKKFLFARDLAGDFSRRVIKNHKYWNEKFEAYLYFSYDSEGKNGLYPLGDSALQGATARHPMAGAFPDSDFYTRPRPFLPGDFVTTDAGTGLVHMAPDHGEDDFILCRDHGINPAFAVEGDGQYREDWPWLAQSGSVINKKLTASNGPICEGLRDAGALLSASDDFQHSYPHSWRSKAKIIYRATPQWFIPMDQPLSAPVNRGGQSLRETALGEISETRWVPERAINRMRAMVEGRPDWVISRQRAWGVPIALYINARGDYLKDKAVNARIIVAFEAGGADAWYDGDHQALLGDQYSLDEWQPIGDILDVWFDSGSTHSFVMEERFGSDLRASLYLEGSDQHRGWFQSSLLESCGTRGRAPYDAVLTHGFTLDAKGYKMSKSLGNTVDPLKLIDQSGADILRLWTATVDYFDDHRIGDEILRGVSDNYRKIRNSFRYLLGALADFDEAERVPVEEMPELERYILHRLGRLDGQLRDAAEDFAFNRYMRELTEFAQENLSAFYFDIRKDSLYCDHPDSNKRRSTRTVLNILYHALVRYIAPILCFTAEEIWQSRFDDPSDSIHLKSWPIVPQMVHEPDFVARWDRVRQLREQITETIEPMRREKIIRSSLEAEVTLPGKVELPIDNDALAEIAIVAAINHGAGDQSTGEAIGVKRTDNHKCGRCWRLLPEVSEDGALCARCQQVLGEDGSDKQVRP